MDATDAANFIKACRDGNVDIVNYLLSNRYIDLNHVYHVEKVNYGFWYYCTALTAACDFDREEIVDILIKNGAKVNYTQNEFLKGINTPIYSSIHRKNYNITKKLLESGVNVNFRDYYPHTHLPIHYAASSGFHEVIELLILHGSDINSLTSTLKHNILMQTPLCIATCNNNIQTVRKLISLGADVNFPSEPTGQIALDVACNKQYFEIVKILVEAGSNINNISKSGITPLYRVIQRENAEIVKYLLDAGADPTINNIYGESMLNIVCIDDDEIEVDVPRERLIIAGLLLNSILNIFKEEEPNFKYQRIK